jgi:chemotaxis family two-component system response regulator Rcp1
MKILEDSVDQSIKKERKISAVKHTILLVDDSRADVELVRRYLSTGPTAPQLVVAEDGVEALRILREAPSRDRPRPDLILLDLNLPLKDGNQVLAEIKQDPVLRRIPVVVLTSSNAERDIASAYELHANCYLTKPMDIDGFVEALRGIETFWFSVATLPSWH